MYPATSDPVASPSWQASLQNSLGAYLPSILGGLAILLIGWLVDGVRACWWPSGRRPGGGATGGPGSPRHGRR